MRLRAAAAIACLAVAAASSWFSLIGVPPIRFAAVAVLAVLPALLGAVRLPPGALMSVTVLCVPAVMLVAGVPTNALMPHGWPQLPGRLGSGAAQFIVPGSRSAASAWSLSAVMLGSGALWRAGAAVAAAGVGSARRLTIGFILLACPWLAGVCERTPDRSTWVGALVLLGGVLWFSRADVTIALGVITALLSVAIAQAVGPQTRWFGLGYPESQGSPFKSLDTEPTYGPLTGRRTGAPMLDVTAAAPALWRMQTLDYFDGSVWTTAPEAPLPQLPQPRAHREEVAVRVRGLRQDLVIAPGRVDRVSPQGSVLPGGGEAWQLARLPRPGDGYRVVASVVRVSTDSLAHDRAPLDARAGVYSRLGLASRRTTELRLLGWIFGAVGLRLRAPAAPLVDPRIAALALRLQSGARTEWDKVVRVERFLLGGQFRYTTRVPIAGAQPLADFLLRTHAGYCEHFAGAAALLLRLAGVPTRVVAGFATGRQTGPDRYTVRDLDAHDWIEVYFPAYGWVPFNPTPPASPAAVGGSIDPLRLPTPPAGRPQGVPDSAVLGGLAVAAGLMLLWRRAGRRSRRAPQPLERIARRTAGRLEPSTTLAQLTVVLGRIGPRTAALAAETERARFAVGPSHSPGRPRIRLACALVGDVGLLRALLVWAPLPRPILTWSGVVSPAAEEREREQRQQ